ncbi:polysaccharide deacetylase family protein [Paenibacillus puerhi]|uniref:polysaccharide deacetylase family protein n=1 Tax=Paenibacillus puerhi TaxID=2692622 RepID=UPI0038B31B92
MKSIRLCYPQGKFKALTMSYDDGRNADKRLVDIFNRNGIKGTFHINSGLTGKLDRVEEGELGRTYEGHEASAHTLTHPSIARIPKELLVHEVMEDRKNLERIFGYTIRGMSYPGRLL